MNDTYGHEVGDQVLKMVARTLSSNARVFDVIGRWGGEEFVAILVNMDAATLNTVAEKFRRLVGQSSMDQEPSNRGDFRFLTWPSVLGLQPINLIRRTP
ncbi:MAG: GGDEF domain-containing protein [Pseudomonadota bacterium]